ncbi:MAG: TatD family hydrolase [Candidatus Omnitrophica bacterium]|nr:TatD family hydrolase [Candidatus Omnitrophota bacterium]
MLIDTHCHLHFDAFDPDREAVIARAREFGVKYLVNVGTDPATNEAAERLARGRDFMAFTAGLHPHHSHEVPDGAFDDLKKFVKEKKPAAIGEIGLDYFKSEADPQTQKKTFVKMLRLARENSLPVIVHSRNAFSDTLEILKNEGAGKMKGVMHCFSYDAESLGKLLDIGFLASFTCNLTFKNAGPLLEVARAAPLDRLMLETDSPYLAPQIYRGKRNEPSCLAHLAEFLARERGIGREKLEAVTSRTAADFFGFKISDE